MDMNTKPVEAALAAARGTKAELVAISQPAVPAGMKLLARNFLFKGVYVDLHGYMDEADGSSVEAITEPGNLLTFASWLSPLDLHRLSGAVDKIYLADRAAAAGEAKAEGVLLDRARV